MHAACFGGVQGAVAPNVGYNDAAIEVLASLTQTP